MVKVLESIAKLKNEFVLNLIVMGLIGVSGLALGLVYFVMDTMTTQFQSVNCIIPDNSLVSNCQELFQLSLYPILNLKYVLVFGTYFAIFWLVFGLFYMGFKTRKHPGLIIVHILLSLVLGYISIEIANIYRTLLSNETIYNMLIPFGVYNKIMLYFPQFMFFVIFISGLIGFIGIFKSKEQFDEGTDNLG